MNNPICKTVFDSRDCIEYLEYLEQELIDAFNEKYPLSYSEGEHEDLESVDNIDYLFEYVGVIGFESFFKEYSDEINHYNNIKSFFTELEKYGNDWKYGSSIIHEDYFTEYSEELCIEVGEIPKDLPWYIANHIDWNSVADELKADYTEVEYENETYYIR